MAIKSQAARGPQNQSCNYRTAGGVFEWQGMAPDMDPAALPDNKPALVINCRLRAGSINPRGGSKRLLDLGSGGIIGIGDFQVSTPRKMWVVGDGCPGLSSSAGFYVGFYDTQQDPAFQPGIYYNTATQGVVLGAFSGDLYVGVDNALRKVTLIEAPYGELALSVSGSSQDLPLMTFTGFTKITDLMAFDGKFFIGIELGAGTSKVVVWDGVTQSLDLGSINAPAAFGTYRESLIMGFAAAGPNVIRVRPTGVPGATWASVAPSGGTACMRGPGCSATYKDVFWFATGTDALYKFDGTTLTLVPAATSGIGASSLTHSCCVFSGYLFVSYTTPTGHVCIARFDGTTWVGTHKDITAQVATANQARSLVEYRGDLWLGCASTGRGMFLRSTAADTSGTWVVTVPLVISNNGDVRQMLVY
jgi:hypothetical protein